MQTPKPRVGTLEVPQRTPKTARQLKTSGAEPENSSVQSPVTRTPKPRSPKVSGRSPRTPTSEKKRPGRVAELETQLANLQEELKKAKDQLSQSEACKKRANEDADVAKKQLADMSEKLQDSQQQLDEISASEESRIQELRKISQDRDREWESELEAVQKHHSMDSAALASAMNEIQKLKIQLEEVSESEANQAKYAESAHNDVLALRLELSETLAVVEELKNQLNDSKDSEAKALEIVSQTKEQLESVKSTEEALRSEKVKAIEACDSLAMELEKLKAESHGNTQVDDDEESEVAKLRGALEGAERRYQEEYIQTTLQIRSAYELVDQTKSEYCEKVEIMEANLEKSKAELEDLKAKLIEKDEKLHNVTNENKELIKKVKLTTDESKNTEDVTEVKRLEAGLEDLKAKLIEKEEKLQNVTNENKNLIEKVKLTTDENKATEDVMEFERLKADLEDLKRVMFEKETQLKNVTEENNRLTMEKNQVAEGEKAAIMKLGQLAEEAEKSGKKVVRVTEQLDLAQAANAEMEAELRRLKVQSDQWRKAAEAAAAMLSGGNNGKFVERTGSLDSHTIGGKLNSPFSEDMEDESPKKKNGNMLKKIGILLKKSQK